MYSFKLVQTDKLSTSQHTELLSSVFPNTKKFSHEFLKWEYADNPIGNIIGFNAYMGEKLAAHYVTQPVIVKLKGVETKGLLSLNTATHPDHQGKKLFTTLADMTYKYAYENGYDFVYGVANANSTPGFINKLGFQFVTPLLTKIGFGSIPNVKLSDEFDFVRVWDKESLAWRLKNPSLNYIIKNHQILSPTGKFGLNAILASIKTDALSDLKERKTNNFVSPLKLYVGLDSSLNWQKSFYFHLPTRFKSSPLNLIFKDLTGKERSLDKDRVKFQLIDFDGY